MVSAIFYREAGPKDAPAIGSCTVFPLPRASSTPSFRCSPALSFDSAGLPGIRCGEAPPASSCPYTFDKLAKTTNALLEQLKINKYSLFLHDYGGPVGFRIMLAHPQRLQTLIIQNANVYKGRPGANGPALRNIGPIRRHIPKCSMRSSRSPRPNSVPRSARRTLNPITPTPGRTQTPTSPNRANARSRPICYTTTGRTSLLIWSVASVVAGA